MRVSVILAHPNVKSLNHAIAATAVSALERNGHDVRYHDLYGERFDPVVPFGELFEDARLPPEIERHCAELAAADGVVVVHPNWWGQPPAILKGWIDRVLRPGTAYRFEAGDGGEGVPAGLLKAHVVVVFNTSNTEPRREAAVFGDPLERAWRDCVFGLCSGAAFHRKTFSVVITSSREQREAWLAEVERTIDTCFPRAGPGAARRAR